MKILIINNERENLADRTIEWEGHEITFTRYGFEDVVSGLENPAVETTVALDRLDALIEDARRADVVYCESPEALLAWYVLRKRTLPRVPFVIEDEDLLRRVTSLAKWIEQVYGDDVLGDFFDEDSCTWLHHVAAHGLMYIKAGLVPERLFHLPCSSYLLNLVAPELYTRIKHLARDAAPVQTETVRAVSGSILCPGANRRDYATFARSVESLPGKACILGGRGVDEMEIISASKVERLKFVPAGEFLDSLAAARVVVVPLLDGNLSGGENTVTFSMALGKPVVATRTTSTSRIIEHNESGLLVPPRDPAALRDALASLISNKALRKRLGDAAIEKEREISRESRSVLIDVFSAVQRI